MKNDKDKVISTLKKNKLYDYNEVINIDESNKINDFFNNDKINIIRDNQGRIILDYIPFLKSNLKENGRNKKDWIILSDNTKLLIKYNRSHECNLNELIIMYILKSLNINCANYDIATYKDEEILLSTNFLKENEIILNPFSNIPYIDNAYNVLKNSNSNIHFLKTCFADRIYGNIDRFPLNFGIIKNKVNNKTKICPLFDNSDDTNLFIREEKFGFFPSINKKYDSCNKIINYLLNYEEIMHWVNGPVKKTNLNDVITRLYKEKNIYTDSDTYYKFNSFLSDSEKLINEEIKAKKRNFSFKLV